MVGLVLADSAWMVVLGGGLIVWAVYAIRHRQHPATRAEVVTWVLLMGGFASLFIGFGMAMVGVFVEPYSSSVHLIDLAVQVVGVGLILLGVCVPWWMLTGNHGYVEKYRGAPEVPTLRRIIATIGVALGVFLVSAGVLFATSSEWPPSPTLIILGAVGGAGALVGMGGAFAALIVQSSAETWRQRQQGE